MNRTFILLLLSIFCLNFSFAQNNFASELIIVNGEGFGANESNIAAYNIATKTYSVFDSLFTSSVQDLFIEDSIAYVSAGTKIFSYNLNTKTKIAEAPYFGVSPSKGSLFVDEANLYVGNWYGQTDSNLYAFNKMTLAFEYAVTEATTECGGGLSLNDTLYVAQKNKGSLDGCAPFGCFADTTGSILVVDAITGTYVRTIDLGVSGSGISQIYEQGNYIFAVCTDANKIIKIELATDSIVEEISLAPFTQSLDLIGTKLYLDLNGKAGYFDLADGSNTFGALDLNGTAIAYDANTETAFTTATDFSSFGKLNIYDLNSGDTTEIGVSPEAIAIYYVENAAPIALDDTYFYDYDDNVSDYSLDVLANDIDPDGSILNIENLSATAVTGATVSVVGNKILYTRATGIATKDHFTYQACDNNGLCSTANVEITLKSLTSISELETKENISIYPNPTSENITIATENELKTVTIYSTTGKKLKFSNENQINLQDLAKGVYFVEVKTSKGVLTQVITLK